MSVEQRIEKVVLGGGPGGGKTSGIPRIRDHFKKDGWLVLVSREVPTWLCDEWGYELREPGRNISIAEFQKEVLKYVIDQEERLVAHAVASGHPKVLILCDRGRFDGLGYQDHDTFYDMARECFGQSKDDLFDYSGCVFLLSPAVDNPELYEKIMGGNSARREDSAEKGRTQNDLSMNACVGISRMYIVDNSTHFDEKIARAIEVIGHFLSDSEYERKYVSPQKETLVGVDVRALLEKNHIHTVSAHISQMYLLLGEQDIANGIKTRRVRSKTLGDHRVDGKNYLTLKGPKRDGGGSEKESVISTSLFLEYVNKSSDPTRSEIIKTRYYFIYKNRYWELDVFTTPCGQRFILEVEHLPGEDPQTIEPPPFFGPLEDATDNVAFSNQKISEKR